jgi:hypothetical protein
MLTMKFPKDEYVVAFCDVSVPRGGRQKISYAHSLELVYSNWCRNKNILSMWYISVLIYFK